MGEYREENRIMKYSENPSKEAVAWQGYDAFVGMDNYRNEVLKAGTILVKMEPSNSGYFTTLEEYRKQNLNSNIISKGLQLQPWEKEEGVYLYRSYVSIWKLTKDVEVAIGETAANKDYGKGGITQIYIAGYDGKNPENNKAINLLEKTGEEQLKNYVIPEDEAKIIKEEHEQHVLKRNYFCHLRQKEKLIDLRNSTDDIYVKSDCKNKLKEIDEKIITLQKDLKDSYELIGNIPSKTYDEKIGYLSKKIKIIELNKEFKEIDNEKEKNILEVNKNKRWNKFRWKVGLSQHVKITSKNDGSYATLGRKRWAYMNIDDFSQDTILHELGHVLGLMHEHQRPDRDDYILVNTEAAQNINGWSDSKIKNNYEKIGEKSYRWFFKNDLKATPDYDYVSIMHYSTAYDSVTKKYRIERKDGILWNSTDVSSGICLSYEVGRPKVRGLKLSDLDKQFIKTLY